MIRALVATLTVSLLGICLAYGKAEQSRKIASTEPFGVDGVKQIRMRCDTASYPDLNATIGQISTLIKDGYKLVAVVKLDHKEQQLSRNLYDPNTCVYTLVRQ